MGQLLKPNEQETLLQQLLGTDSITESICNWNAARYEQVPMHELTLDLLREELQETNDAYIAEDYIGIMDGYADVFFVTIGALWKTGLSAKQIDSLMDNVNQMMPMIPSPMVAFMWWEDEVDNNLLAMLALSVFKRLTVLLGNEQLALDTFRAICISNNTKVIKKTEAGIKANINKGDAYVPPTEALKLICERIDQ